MWKNILSVVLGLAVMSMAVFLVEAVSMTLFPTPPSLDLTAPGALDQVPMGAKVGVVVAWCTGALVGGTVGAWFRGPEGALRVAVIVGILVVLAVVANVASIPHPVWMTVLGLALPVPLAALGPVLAPYLPAIDGAEMDLPAS